jgi:hypothetical protein
VFLVIPSLVSLLCVLSALANASVNVGCIVAKLSGRSKLFAPVKPRKLITYSVRLTPEQDLAVRALKEESGCRGVATLLMLAVGYAAEHSKPFCKFAGEMIAQAKAVEVPEAEDVNID